jgi:hypothetical protein
VWPQGKRSIWARASKSRFYESYARAGITIGQLSPSSEHNLMEASTRQCPAVSSFGGIVLSQCAAACV